MKKQIGYIGLGKMGSAMVARLRRKGWRVVSYDANGTGAAKTIEQLMSALEAPRVIWIMVPAGKPVDDVIQELIPYFSKGDIVVDGGNSFFEDSFRRAEKLRRIGVSFVDVGVSGGPETVRKGKPALMIGGEKSMFGKLKPLFADITRRVSFEYMGASGAGHFVKMVHNGIEYGMMQAYAEGFEILQASTYKTDPRAVAHLWNQGSVLDGDVLRTVLDEVHLPAHVLAEVIPPHVQLDDEGLPGLPWSKGRIHAPDRRHERIGPEQRGRGEQDM